MPVYSAETLAMLKAIEYINENTVWYIIYFALNVQYELRNCRSKTNENSLFFKEVLYYRSAVNACTCNLYSMYDEKLSIFFLYFINS